MNKLELGAELHSTVAKEFALGVGFHGLVRGLKRRSSMDEFDRTILAAIADNASSIEEGLREAGHYLDPASVDSGPVPTWSL